MAEMGFEPIASDIFSRIRKPGNASHLARPAEGCPPQGIYKERLLQVLAGKLGWPVTILRKPWGPKAEFPQQSLTSRYLCLRINSTVDPWVPQESPSSLSLSSLICTMDLIIATSHGKLLLVPGNFTGESSQVGGIALGVF